jgi:Fe-S cluster assembly protein SufB
MNWVDGSLGSKVTMTYPAVLLMGEHVKGEVLSIAFAGEGQHQDAGVKMALRAARAHRPRRRRARLRA